MNNDFKAELDAALNTIHQELKKAGSIEGLDALVKLCTLMINVLSIATKNDTSN